MITVNLDGSLSHKAIDAAYLFKPKKVQVFVEPILNATQLYDTVEDFFQRGYDALVFDEDALVDKVGYNMAVQAVELIEKENPGLLTVVVYKYPSKDWYNDFNDKQITAQANEM